MASIIPKEKDGKIVSYKFKACVGRDDCGKQVFRCTTWKVPAGLVPSKAVKAAEKAAGEPQRGHFRWFYLPRGKGHIRPQRPQRRHPPGQAVYGCPRSA